MKNSLLICPACENRKAIRVGTKNGHTIEKCAECATIFSDISPNVEEDAGQLKDLYDHYYDAASFELASATEVSLQRIVDSFDEYRHFGRLLDIGYGEGGMLSVAEKNSWLCFGTELSPHSLKYGEQNGWTVSRDAIADSRFPKGEFDVVTMIELIEHVPNPDEFLSAAFELLRPGGLLFLTTPNSRSINTKVLGLKWSVFSPPEHITIWSPYGIKKALNRNRFASKRIRTEGFNPVEIMGKLRSGKGAEPSERNESAFALNEAFSKNRLRRFMKAMVNNGLSLFRLGDGLKIWAIKKSL